MKKKIVSLLKNKVVSLILQTIIMVFSAVVIVDGIKTCPLFFIVISACIPISVYVAELAIKWDKKKQAEKEKKGIN